MSYSEKESVAMQNDAQQIAHLRETIDKDILTLQDELQKVDPVGAAIKYEQVSAMQDETVRKQFMDAAKGVEQAAVQYERAKQLQTSGQHIAEMQQRIMEKNRQVIGGMNADIMTSKRVATINQQNTIHANVVTDYMQVSIIFLCVAIVIMFVFGVTMKPLKQKMNHPLVLMQLLLALLLFIYIGVILYKVFTNTNHYRMLYQERVFDVYDPDEDDVDPECEECPPCDIPPAPTRRNNKCSAQTPSPSNHHQINHKIKRAVHRAHSDGGDSTGGDSSSGNSCGGN